MQPYFLANIGREQLQQYNVDDKEQHNPSTHLLPSPVPPRKSLLSRRVARPSKQTESNVQATDLLTSTNTAASSECKTQ